VDGLSTTTRRAYPPRVPAESFHPPPIRDLEAPALEAVVEVMFLAAFADGDFGEDERVHFFKSIESLTDRSLSGETLDRLVARIRGDLEAQGREARLVAVRERLPDKGARQAALVLAIQLTAADGIIRTTERELIMEAADALEVERDLAADWVARVGPP
jgi:tellurite resistance protein